MALMRKLLLPILLATQLFHY